MNSEHKTKEEAIEYAFRLIASDPQGGILTVHKDVEGFVHKEENCECLPDVYEIKPQKNAGLIH